MPPGRDPVDAQLTQVAVTGQTGQVFHFASGCGRPGGQTGELAASLARRASSEPYSVQMQGGERRAERANEAHGSFSAAC